MILERIFIFRKLSHRYIEQGNKNLKQNEVSVYLTMASKITKALMIKWIKDFLYWMTS